MVMFKSIHASSGMTVSVIHVAGVSGCVMVWLQALPTLITQNYCTQWRNYIIWGPREILNGAQSVKMVTLFLILILTI